jgi:hypothetical protein
MDLHEEAKRDILEVLVKIRKQTVKMSATIYHIENHLKWGEEKYSRKSILIEHNVRLIHEEVDGLIEELKIKMKGVGLKKISKYLSQFKCCLYIIYWSLRYFFHSLSITKTRNYSGFFNKFIS